MHFCFLNSKKNGFTPESEKIVRLNFCKNICLGRMLLANWLSRTLILTILNTG